MDTTKTTTEYPAESEGLGASGDDRFIIGRTEGVHDDAARLVTDFQPTIYELEVLASHYLDMARDSELWWRVSEQVGSSEIRAYPLAHRRMGTIESILGAERFTAAIAAAQGVKAPLNLPQTRARFRRFAWEVRSPGRCRPKRPECRH